MKYAKALQLAGILGCATFAAFARASDEPALPNDACILELHLPPTATAAVDGRDYGNKRRLEFSPLHPGQIYSSRLTVTFADGKKDTRDLLLKGGWNVPLALTAQNNVGPELIVQTAAHGSLFALSPRGEYLATSDGKTVALWEVETGRKLRTFDWQAPNIINVLFTPDSQCLLTVDLPAPPDPLQLKGRVLFWDINTGKTARHMEGSRVAFARTATN